MGKILKDTKNAELKENAPWDSWWGIGRNEKGKNMLGKALMDIRGKNLIYESRLLITLIPFIITNINSANKMIINKIKYILLI